MYINVNSVHSADYDEVFEKVVSELKDKRYKTSYDLKHYREGDLSFWHLFVDVYDGEIRNGCTITWDINRFELDELNVRHLTIVNTIEKVLVENKIELLDISW